MSEETANAGPRSPADDLRAAAARYRADAYADYTPFTFSFFSPAKQQDMAALAAAYAELQDSQRTPSP